MDSILDAPAGIGGEPHVFICLERGHAFDQADGPDRDQIVLVAVGGIILLRRVKQREDVSWSKAASQGPPDRMRHL